MVVTTISLFHLLCRRAFSMTQLYYVHNLDLEEVVFEIKYIAEYLLSLYRALISPKALPEFFGIS